MKAWSLAAILLLVTMAGCIAEQPDLEAEDEPVANEFAYQDDRINITSIEDTDWEPTLAEPPQYQLGQWWKVRVTEYFTGASHEAYRVVAGQEEDFWLIGMPTHDFSNDLMVIHVPGFGQVRKDTLGFEAHDQWLDPVKFPIKEDDTWETVFQAGTQSASVMSVDGLQAEIEMVGQYHITLTYDAEVGAVTKFMADGYASYEVIEHGDAFHEDVPGYEGLITVPHMSDLIMFHGRAAGAVGLSGGQIGPAVGIEDTLDVDRTYDRVSFLLILGDVLLQNGVPGYYQSVATAPDGTEFSQTLLPTEEPIRLAAYKHDKPGGQWTFQNIAAGPGAAFAEGIGYHVYDIELPSGHILPSIGEHQHGSDNNPHENHGRGGGGGE